MQICTYIHSISGYFDHSELFTWPSCNFNHFLLWHWLNPKSQLNMPMKFLNHSFKSIEKKKNKKKIYILFAILNAFLKLK